MSRRQISRSADLRRLLDEGYELEIRGGLLLVHHVPYVTAAKAVAYGTLVSELRTAAGVTTAPSPHTIQFTGTPCNADGQRLDTLINDTTAHDLGGNLVVETSFSHKPIGRDGYADYYEKVSTYVGILGSYAAAIDADATARTFHRVEERDANSPFLYSDTSSARVGIEPINEKLAVPKVAIVGLGGTGSYVLDLIAKAPIGEIHLFDGDRFLDHNAFRAPGAASLAQLEGGPNKATHFAQVYAAMRDGLVPHPYALDQTTAAELDEMDSVFLTLDPGPAKRSLVEHLEARAIPFIDCGVGVNVAGDLLAGLVRVTTSLPGRPVAARHWISLGEADTANDYATNIQLVELNALAAAFAVLRWKRMLGFYRDLEREQHMLYTIDGNTLDNEGVD